MERLTVKIGDYSRSVESERLQSALEESLYRIAVCKCGTCQSLKKAFEDSGQPLKAQFSPLR